MKDDCQRITTSIESLKRLENDASGNRDKKSNLERVYALSNSIIKQRDEVDQRRTELNQLKDQTTRTRDELEKVYSGARDTLAKGTVMV